MKRPSRALAALLLFGALPLCHAEEPARLAVLDFEVQSDNPSYRYLGKGFAEFVSVNLLKIKDLQLVEREKRNQLLEEMEFSLSDLTDPSSQAEVGKILSATHLVMGNIYDFAGKLSVAYQLVATDTGQILLKNTVEGPVSRYNAMTSGIAREITRYLAAARPAATEGVAKAPKPKPEKPKPEKPTAAEKETQAEEVLLAFSTAVDAYDKKDVEGAKKQLKEARKLDPGNKAVAIYLDKLLLNTSKFKTIPEPYYPTQNPAYLGILQYDRLYFSNANNIMTAGSWQVIQQFPSLQMHENDNRLATGYQLPLFQRMGLEVSYLQYSTRDEIWDPIMMPTDTSGRFGTGAVVAWGWNPMPALCIGAAVSLYAQIRKGFAEGGSGTIEYRDPTSFEQAWSGGFLLKNKTASILFDCFAGYSTEGIIWFNPATFPNKRSEMEVRGAPMFNENTLTLALNQRRTFVILKQLNDVFLETGAYYGRLMPAVEHWVLPWLAARAGAEAAVMKLGEELRPGFGGTGGVSFRIGRKGWEADLSVTYRRRPSRFIDGEYVDEVIPFITVSKSKSFIYR
jgi:TolB-like protein